MTTAIFAGGCFWCLQADFDQLAGVQTTEVGYDGGAAPCPTYQQVCSGQTNYREVLKVTFDPDQIGYWQLLQFFWQHTDPTQADGQFHDIGPSYQTAIFYLDDWQRKYAELSKRVQQLVRPAVHTDILASSHFCLAEPQHQRYYQSCPAHYQRYRAASGRDQVLDEKNRLIKWPWFGQIASICNLNELSYQVTQLQATEPPFQNQYWNHHEVGIYVDIVTGQPLFDSADQFDSGSGWPSFRQPITPDAVVEVTDTTHSMQRIEIRSSLADSHLGHLFHDGPPPYKTRYCINSAALHFIPAADKDKLGYIDHVC